MMITDKTFVAIDTDNLERANTMLDVCYGNGTPLVYGVKFGLQFFLKFGAVGINELMRGRRNLKLFLDLKLHDIPNTVKGALNSLTDIKPDYLTVHCGGGLEMLKVCAEFGEVNQIKIIGVTMLTSLHNSDADKMYGFPSNTLTISLNMTKLAKEAKLSGIVCSYHGVRRIKDENPELITIVPGIRLHNDRMSEHKHLARPNDALQAGADFIVIGRPITDFENITDGINAVNYDI